MAGWTSHKFFATLRNVSEAWNEEFGRLFDGPALQARLLTQAKASLMAGISATRWRQIANGTEPKANPVTVARMARVMNVGAEKLRAVRHPEAARALEIMDEIEPASGSVSRRDRLLRIRSEVDALLNEFETEL